MNSVRLVFVSCMGAILVLAGCAGMGEKKEMAAKPKADIVDTAVAAGQFKTLVTAVQAAGLVETLKGKGPYTVFAPTDAAFAKLPKGTVQSLLQPKNKGQLTAILTYHVVAGQILAKDVVGKKTTVTTVNGKTLLVDGTKGVKAGPAKVSGADVLASNGVIHVVDTVILPPK